MAHTLPDYTTKYKMTTVFAQIDTGELAVRLGSPVSFDRRGNVIFYDDFETSYLKWNDTGSATGWAVAVDGTQARSGEQSAKLTTPTGPNEWVYIYKSVGYPALKRIGLEVSWQVDIYSNGIAMWAKAYDGTNLVQGGILHNTPVGEFEYLNENGSWVPMKTGLAIYQESHMFNTMKFVMDLDTQKYVRAIMNNNVYDISDKNLRVTSSSTDAHLEVRIGNRVAGSGTSTAYVDDFILTQNEP